MAKLKAGDRVSCKLLPGAIVSGYSAYDEIKVFEIIAADNVGYFLYVPSYIYMQNSATIDNFSVSKLNISNRFLGEQCAYISESLVYRVISKLDGMFCNKCHEFYDYAAANQPDNTLICWNCRTYR